MAIPHNWPKRSWTHVDAAIVTLPLKHPALHIEGIRRDKLVVCLRKDHSLASKATLEATDLQDNLTVSLSPAAAS